MDGNKLIGDFHGAEYSDSTQRLYYGESVPDFASFINAGNVNIEEAKYRQSWDWLMPVVSKILSISCAESYKKAEMLRNSLSYVDIEMTWHWVVDFIKWLNQKN